MTLTQYIETTDAQYDPKERMVLGPAHGHGYHTRLAPNAPAHSTREAMDYALALLQTGDGARAQRACDIVERVCALQTTDPTDSHYGIWGWFLEEPPKQMAPADWNWADFIGARLAQMLRVHAGQLRPVTTSAARVALQHAVLSIFRRNVSASYTNIAIMGGVVTAAGGELLSMPFLVEYGRKRLADVVALVKEVGGFTEYNSPTYTRIALEEAERALMLVSDAGVRAHAEFLRVTAWRTIAEHYHPATGQIAGPCSRAYADWLLPDFHQYLAEQTGASVPFRATDQERDRVSLVEPLPCPKEIARRFADLPEDPHQIVCRFGKHQSGDVLGTTWMNGESCLGTVNRGIGWNQCRPLLGYWRTERDPAVCLRVRFLKDGRDFAPTYIHQAQAGPRVLGGLQLSYGAGDFHPHFFKADCFEMSDLRVRFSLAGAGVKASDLGDGRFALEAGNWRAIIHTPASPCTIGDRQIRWQVVVTPTEACIDAVLYDGPATQLDARNTLLRLGYALELLRPGEAASSERPLATEAGDEIRWTWGSLSVSSPRRPVPFTW